ncbi:hypothetical protein SK128_027847, partial [Halocaridina rubra]
HLKDDLTPPSTAAEQSTTSAAPDLSTGSPTIKPISRDPIVRRSSRVTRLIDKLEIQL